MIVRQLSKQYLGQTQYLLSSFLSKNFNIDIFQRKKKAVY